MGAQTVSVCYHKQETEYQRSTRHTFISEKVPHLIVGIYVLLFQHHHIVVGAKAIGYSCLCWKKREKGGGSTYNGLPSLQHTVCAIVETTSTGSGYLCGDHQPTSSGLWYHCPSTTNLYSCLPAGSSTTAVYSPWLCERECHMKTRN